MKKVLILSLFAMSALWNAHAEELHVVNFNALTEQELVAIGTGEITDVAISFEVGQKLPFHISIQGDVIESEEMSTSLTIKKPFYLKMIDRIPHISFDLLSWKSLIPEDEALFPFTGEIHAGLLANDEEHSFFFLLEASERE